MTIPNFLTKQVVGIIGLLLSVVITGSFALKSVRDWEFNTPIDQFDQQASMIGTPSLSTDMPATSTVTPMVEFTPVPTLPPPSAVELIPVSGFSNATIKEVVHIENGHQTLIKILTPEELAGQFFAEVEVLWSRWEYVCTVFEQNSKYLFCFGGRLPATTQAVIRVHQLMDEYGSSTLVFSTDFAVPELVPTPTNPPGIPPSQEPAPTNTPEIFPTVEPPPPDTPTIEPPPLDTPTPKPTRTPRPTKPPKDGD